MIDCKEEVIKLLSDGNTIALEGVTGTFINEVSMDEERWDRKARDMLNAYLNDDVDSFCVAVTGWSMHSLLARAGVIPDSQTCIL